MNEFLIIAPTQRVLDVLSEAMQANQIQGSVYVKLIGKDRPTKIPASVTLVGDIGALQTKSLKVLCCSEEAIYCLSNNGSEWTLQFSPPYLRMLDKLSFKKRSAQEHVRVLFDMPGLNEQEKFILANLSLIPHAGIPGELFHDWCKLNSYDEIKILRTVVGLERMRKMNRYRCIR